ncbi:MAG: hypothetical protein Q9174_004280 [Haloplaca sp. 1 TL-2023]
MPFRYPGSPLTHPYGTLYDPIQDARRSFHFGDWRSSTSRFSAGSASRNHYDQEGLPLHYRRTRWGPREDSCSWQHAGSPMRDPEIPHYYPSDDLAGYGSGDTEFHHVENFLGSRNRRRTNYHRSRSHPFSTPWTAWPFPSEYREPAYLGTKFTTYGKSNGNDGEQDFLDTHDVQGATYTVEEPGFTGFGDPLQSPKWTGRRHGTQHPADWCTADRLLGKKGVDCWTLPSSPSSSPEAPKTSTPPPSPQTTPIADATSIEELADDRSPSDTSPHPFPPSSAREAGTAACDNRQFAEDLSQTALTQIHYELLEWARQLRQEERRLRRSKKEMERESARLQIRERNVREQEARYSEYAARNEPD